jgi:type IV pilus assembly protein PilA
MEQKRGDQSNAVETPASGLRAGLAALMLVAIAIALILFYFHQQKNDVVRRQVGEAIASADGVRVAVAIYRARTGNWPADDSAAGLLSPSAVSGKYVDGIHIEQGDIVIALGGGAERTLQGKRVRLTPYFDASVVKWHCSSRDIGADLLPQNCR